MIVDLLLLKKMIALAKKSKSNFSKLNEIIAFDKLNSLMFCYNESIIFFTQTSDYKNVFKGEPSLLDCQKLESALSNNEISKDTGINLNSFFKTNAFFKECNSLKQELENIKNYFKNTNNDIYTRSNLNIDLNVDTYLNCMKLFKHIGKYTVVKDAVKINQYKINNFICLQAHITKLNNLFDNEYYLTVFIRK